MTDLLSNNTIWPRKFSFLHFNRNNNFGWKFSVCVLTISKCCRKGESCKDLTNCSKRIDLKQILNFINMNKYDACNVFNHSCSDRSIYRKYKMAWINST